MGSISTQKKENVEGYTDARAARNSAYDSFICKFIRYLSSFLKFPEYIIHTE